jgi:hypothetical protein
MIPLTTYQELYNDLKLVLLPVKLVLYLALIKFKIKNK